MTSYQVFFAALRKRLYQDDFQALDFNLEMQASLGDGEFPELENRDDAGFISDFCVHGPRLVGSGGKILSVLTQLADEHQVAIALNPWASSKWPDTLTQTQLEAWYKRLGWNWWNQADHVMLREPRPVRKVA